MAFCAPTAAQLFYTTRVEKNKDAVMENYFDRKFQLRYFEMNKHGEASPTTILTLLEETAAEHCYNIDYCLYSLESQNIGWVLISGILDMVRYPKYKETIVIRTWISKYSVVKGHRENIIFDDNGNIIGRAMGVWVFYDIAKRKPIPIMESIKSKWGINREVSNHTAAEAITIIHDGGHQLEYDIHKSDIDSNNHVNNIRYFHWLMQSLPDEIVDSYLLKRVNAKFYSEATFGEKIRVYNRNEMDQKICLHTMRSNVNDRLLAAAHTIWEKK